MAALLLSAAAAAAAARGEAYRRYAAELLRLLKQCKAPAEVA